MFDSFLPTASAIGMLFVDGSGHHYFSLVAEAMVQRIMRDYVCPPTFVMAVREGTDGAAAEEEGAAHRERPPVDYANSGLPWRFPFPAGVDRVAIRVRTSTKSGGRMPSLYSVPVVAEPRANKHMYEVRDLFPLFKTPLPVVSEGLCRAIFDHPYGDVNSHYRILRRDPSFGLRGAPTAGDSSGNGDWWRSVQSALTPPNAPPPPPPFLHPPRLDPNLYPLHVPPHPYLMAVVRNNPFLPCISCSKMHSGALLAKGDVGRVRSVLDTFDKALAARGGFVSSGDALYKSASLVVYNSPRSNVDPLYLLRTMGEYGVPLQASCNIDGYGATLQRDSLTADARRLPLNVAPLRDGPYDSCAPPPLVDVRARIVVSAYLHARRRV